jgi:hypothetical protein
MTGAAHNTITTLLVQLGTACAAYRDRKLRHLTLRGFGQDVDYATLIRTYGIRGNREADRLLAV